MYGVLNNKKYYDESYAGEISAKHILISVTDEVSEDEALSKAKDLIKQLNDDESIIDIYVNQYMKQFNNIHS